ncbi:MAG: Putative peroxiredoxin [Bacteroidota bacterium]|nr:MAG: Putative peroxiredoxin [Bacteroidota bacterium]
MARTPSNMLDLGTKAPNFTLPNAVDAKVYSFSDVQGKRGTVVMFICNHCPYVMHVFDGIASLANDYMKQGFGFVAISSNDVENYPDDSPELMKKTAEEQGFNFPYLYDESQDVAKAYDAACTPDFYLFNAEMSLVYRGQMDNSRPKNNIPVTGNDLRAALDALLTGTPIDSLQKPSLGCNIKWKVS